MEQRLDFKGCLGKLEFSFEDKERKNQKAQHTSGYMSIFYFRSDTVIWRKGIFSRCSNVRMSSQISVYLFCLDYGKYLE